MIRGNYSIKEELGSGSYGRVYRCEHLISGEPFAIKIIPQAKL